MKKNKMLRLASAMMVLTLLTTSMISGTFAKYTTTGSISDTARVAKFGVAITTSGSLFSDAYVDKNAENIPAVWTTGYVDTNKNAITVAYKESGTSENLVAPGTQSAGNGMTFGITGQPEVATKFTTKIMARDIYLKSGYSYAVMVPDTTVTAENYADLAKGNKLYAKDSTGNTYTLQTTATAYSKSGDYYILHDEVASLTDDYYPVVYTLAGNSNAAATSGTTTASSSTQAVMQALSDKITGGTTTVAAIPSEDKENLGMLEYNIETTYNPNEMLDDKLAGETLTWKWDIGTTSEDPKDTILGDMMAYSKDYATAATKPYFVVAKSKADGSVYKDVTYTDDNSTYSESAGAEFKDKSVGTDYVMLGTDVIAGLKTGFDITFTVEQID